MNPVPGDESMTNDGALPAISVVVPAYNEQEAIGPQLDAIHAVLQPSEAEYEVVVVDDGSQDATSQRALESGARVFRHLENRGYGAAVKSGITLAKHDTIVMIDADGTYPASEIPGLVGDLKHADMVVGARTGAEVHVPLIRRPAKWVLRWLAARVAGRKIPDLNSGLRAFRRDSVMQYFQILPNQFSLTTTITLALLADDYRIVYRPINYYPRVGQSKIRPWHFMDFSVLVLRVAMLFQPLRVFVPLAMGFALVGLVKVGFDIVATIPRTDVEGWSVFYEAVLSTSAVLMLLVAAQLLLVGMVADAVQRKIAQQRGPQPRSRAIRIESVEEFSAEPVDEPTDSRAVEPVEPADPASTETAG